MIIDYKEENDREEDPVFGNNKPVITSEKLSNMNASWHLGHRTMALDPVFGGPCVIVASSELQDIIRKNNSRNNDKRKQHPLYKPMIRVSNSLSRDQMQQIGNRVECLLIKNWGSRGSYPGYEIGAKQSRSDFMHQLFYDLYDADPKSCSLRLEYLIQAIQEVSQMSIVPEYKSQTESSCGFTK